MQIAEIMPEDEQARDIRLPLSSGPRTRAVNLNVEELLALFYCATTSGTAARMRGDIQLADALWARANFLFDEAREINPAFTQNIMDQLQAANAKAAEKKVVN